ncbi:MAG: hypothetical protein COU35_05055 [Candidatus Magasanikbacteria bacterium CG10_big_fil_rev_8_21_14_0_10_47_10]|uniref:Phage shock protein PspC N-terminal domain-containing protein n=1 Tax=Candidatus Magasanikbacteria bacterium CG10_big_fil_rev_8_21_14_0_10_47_10 TaxID=1974652 RepID=A0A2H0TP61_9BACT|nr:MAG: hypothetical protein COU35_05055 [Candidatus Magasanikbacteria bacterium CG10_big_fil_rev_8_21_14_0_10_47_10]
MKRLYRSKKERMIAGVCGGIAAYYSADPTIIRLATALVFVLTGFFPVVMLYIIAAIIIPESKS